MHKEWRDVAMISWEGLVLSVGGEGPQARGPGGGAGGGGPPPPRRSGHRPLKTARRAVWAAPYGLRFAATGIGKYWRSGAAGMGIETIRANSFLKSGVKRTGAVL